MAARTKRKELDEKWRDRIKVSMLINRLNDHVDGKDTTLSPTQIKAAEILLRKVAPDLQSIDGEILTSLMGQDNLDTSALMQQIGSSLATNPAMLIDILRNDPQARQSVFQAIEQLKREVLQPVPAIEMPQHTTTQ